MTSVESSERIHRAIEGLAKLKRASLLMVVSWILGVVALAVIVVSVVFGVLHGALAMGPRPQSVEEAFNMVMRLLGAAIGGIAILIVSLIIQLIAVFALLVPSFRRLRDYNATLFGTPSTLVSVGYIGGVVLLLASVGGLTASVFARSIGGVLMSAILLILGLILLVFIGKIGVIVGCFRMKNEFGESLFLASGIVLIISIITMFVPHGTVVSSVLSFIAWIMMYIASGSALKKLQQQLSSREVASAPSTATGGQQVSGI